MAERVAIIGGSTPGRDHFPFPVRSDSVGLGTVYPIGLSLADACLAFYRVKRWEIVVDVVADDPGDGIPPNILAATFYADAGDDAFNNFSTAGPYARESDLAVPTLTYSGDTSTTTEFMLFGSEEDGYSGIPYRAVYDGGLIYPALIISVDVDSGPSTLFGGVQPGATLTFLNTVMTLRAYSEFYSGTVSIQPDEWWPYANSEGLPVYDTATGAQLRDPLS